MLQRRKSESHASAYLTPPEYADDKDASMGPELSKLVAEIHRLIDESPAQSSEFIESYRTQKEEKTEPETERDLEPEPEAMLYAEDTTRATRHSSTTTTATTATGLGSSGASTPSRLGISSARHSLDGVYAESRNVRKAVGTELRRLFTRR